MNDTVKLIIEIPRIEYEQTCNLTLHNRTFYDEAIRNGTPLDDVKAEIDDLPTYMFEAYKLKSRVLEILDNIGKAESEDNAK